MTTDESTEVLFNIYVTQSDDVFGVILSVDDQSDSEHIPCFRSVFKSLTGGNPTVDGVTQIYAECHKDAMDAVGFDGPISLDDFEGKLHKSVELASDMMSKYGLSVLDLEVVPEATMKQLFSDDWPDVEPGEEEPAPKRTLN